MADKQKVHEPVECPECHSSKLSKDSRRAELVCQDCGLVIDENLIDYSPEWRAFNQEQHEKRARTGAPMTPLRHDKGLSTTISRKNKDYYGRSIPSKTRSQIYRLRKWHRRTRVSTGMERNIANALSQLTRMTSGIGLPRNVRETAAMIYRKAASNNLIRGRSIDGMAAAALYAACRQCDVPRTLDEISEIANIPRKEIGRNYRYLARELKLKLRPTSPKEYIPRFASDLDLSEEVRREANSIIDRAAEEELTSGKGPTGIAAAALYISSVLCGERKTQKEIAETSGVTEVTVRNRYKEITKHLDIDVKI